MSNNNNNNKQGGLRRSRVPCSSSYFNRPNLTLAMLEPPTELVLPGSAEHVSSEMLAQYHRMSKHVYGGELDDDDEEDDSNNSNDDQQQQRKTSSMKMRKEEIAQRLDKVEKETVGRLMWNRLKSNSYQWAKDIFAEFDDEKKMVLATEDEQKERLEKRGVPKSMKMHETIRTILDILTSESEMYKQIYLKSSLASCYEARTANAVMFMVEKIGKTVDVMVNGVKVQKNMLRVVTDARDANTRTTNIIPYHIFKLEAFLQCISNVYHKSKDKKWFCINADLRHWFFQIPLPEHWRNFFRLQFEECFYIPVVLPMGWYLSPPIAQAVTWSILLSGDPPGVSKVNEILTMPEWLPLDDDKGGVFVMQDNIFVVTDDEDLAKDWKAHLAERALFFDVQFKSSQGVDVIELSEENNNFTEFNGIDIGFAGWKVAQRKERKPLDGVKHDEMTHREIHSLLGEVLWDLRVRQQPALDHVQFMRLFKANTPKSSSDWGQRNTTFSSENFDILKLEVAEARKHILTDMWPEWNALVAPEAMKVYAVDASMGAKAERGGTVLARIAICEMIGRPKFMQWKWKNDKRPHSYIGEAELEAIVWAVEDAIEKNPDVKLIVIATDSLCAKGWVERMYSERPYALELLRYLRKLLTVDESGATRFIKLSCVYLLSEHNIADVPTRDDETSVEGSFSRQAGNNTENVLRRLVATKVVVQSVSEHVRRKALMAGSLVVRQARLATEFKDKKVSEEAKIEN